MTREAASSEIRKAFSYDGKRFVETDEAIVREIPLTIYVNGRQWITIACLGMHVDELAVGFLHSEGILRRREELEALVISPDGRQIRVRTAVPETLPGDAAPCRVLTSSGARLAGIEGGEAAARPDDVQVTAQEINALVEGFIPRTGLHDRTGGTHAAALVLDGEIRCVREDIGRHNAIDMLDGYAFLNGLDCRNAVILRSGRVSAEVVHKVRQLGVPLVVSLSVPTTLAVDMATAAGITLVGSARGGRMKVYSNERRVRM